MKKTKTAKPIAVLLVFLMLLALCACGAKGDKKTSGGDAQVNFSSLFDYAKKLEEAGDTAAAAAVYEIIVKNGGAGPIDHAHEENPLMKEADEADAYMDLFEKKGGDGK